MQTPIRRKELTERTVAASERELYGLYTEKTTTSEGNSHETELVSRTEEAMVEVEKEIREVEHESEEDDIVGSAIFTENPRGEMWIDFRTREVGEANVMGLVERKEDRVLEEREEWPSWLKSAVDRLQMGERGIELNMVLKKFVQVERALGFKGEKTVSLNCLM